MNDTKYLKLVILAVIGVLALSMMGKVFETVDQGTYQVKQAAFTGSMSAKMDPGIWLQMFGDIQPWPKAETFYFTKDAEGGDGDMSIGVTFVDGSKARISGSMRVMMPSSESQAIDLVVKQGYKTMNDVEQKLILPMVQNALTMTANMMTATESYSDKRGDFLAWSWDQVSNGIYETETVIKDYIDPTTKEKTSRPFRVVKLDKEGKKIFQPNQLHGTGITVSTFVIKEIIYSDTVDSQIKAQQKAYMDVATAKAEVMKAEQEKLKLIAEGQAAVAKSQYEQELIKVKATVEAQQRLDVAKLDKEAAAMQKAKEILIGEGEAERKRLAMSADGALTQKLNAWIEVNKMYADAMSKQRQVPEIVMGGASGSGVHNAAEMISLLTAKTAKELSLDMSQKK